MTHQQNISDNTNYSAMNDEELGAAAKNDAKAAAELISRVMPSIRALAVSIDPRISEDLLQEGLLGALSAVGSYDEKRGRLRTYLMTCAKNKMLSSIKRNSPIGGESEDPAELEDISASREDQRELFERLYLAMEKCLTPLERSALSCFMTGCSYKEIAARLSVSEKSVDNAMQRARKKLRKEFGENGAE